MKLPAALLACLLTLSLGFALAAEGDKDEGGATTHWELQKDKDGVQIYSRNVDASPYDQFKAVTNLKGKVGSAVAMISDAANADKLNSLISGAEVLEPVNPSEYVFRLLWDMPWPVSNRDVIYRRTISQATDRSAVTITDISEPDSSPAKKRFIRITDSRQVWALEPTSTGTVNLTLITHTDPAGNLPTGMVNKRTVKTLFETLKSIKDGIAAGQYADADLSFLNRQ